MDMLHAASSCQPFAQAGKGLPAVQFWPKPCRTRTNFLDYARTVTGALQSVPMKGNKRPFCVYCGSQDNLTVDHVVPLSRWREFRVRRSVLDNKSNRVPCCQACNAAKADMHPREWLDTHPEYRERFARAARYLSDTVRSIAGIP